MIPLAALEESALPLVAEFTERDQPVAAVLIAFFSSYVSKPAFLISPVSFSADVEAEEDEVEEESVALSLQAASAATEESIIADKQRARSLFLRFLILSFM
jgi:hypothetical protein